MRSFFKFFGSVKWWNFLSKKIILLCWFQRLESLLFKIFLLRAQKKRAILLVTSEPLRGSQNVQFSRASKVLQVPQLKEQVTITNSFLYDLMLKSNSLKIFFCD